MFEKKNDKYLLTLGQKKKTKFLKMKQPLGFIFGQLIFEIA
jgi:hypothetical protein